MILHQRTKALLIGAVHETHGNVFFSHSFVSFHELGRSEVFWIVAIFFESDQHWSWMSSNLTTTMFKDIDTVLEFF